MTIKEKLNNNSQIDNELVLFANELADLSESVIKRFFRSSSLDPLLKEDKSPVTLADTEVELLIRQKIEEKYPEHGICGEEFPETKGNSGYVWHIDPIDGTNAFISGIPLFTTLISLSYNGKPIFGLINQPIINERWQGGEIYQSNFNGKNITTRKGVSLENAVFSSSSPYYFNKEERLKFDLIRSKTKYQKCGGVFLGGDAYIYAMLANGFIDIVFESGLKAHDFLAFVPIIRSAGGIVTDSKGNSISTSSDGSILACGSTDLHKEALRLISSNS